MGGKIEQVICVWCEKAAVCKARLAGKYFIRFIWSGFVLFSLCCQFRIENIALGLQQRIILTIDSSL